MCAAACGAGGAAGGAGAGYTGRPFRESLMKSADGGAVPPPRKGRSCWLLVAAVVVAYLVVR